LTCRAFPCRLWERGGDARRPAGQPEQLLQPVDLHGVQRPPDGRPAVPPAPEGPLRPAGLGQQPPPDHAAVPPAGLAPLRPVQRPGPGGPEQRRAGPDRVLSSWTWSTWVWVSFSFCLRTRENTSSWFQGSASSSGENSWTWSGLVQLDLVWFRSVLVCYGLVQLELVCFTTTKGTQAAVNVYLFHDIKQFVTILFIDYCLLIIDYWSFSLQNVWKSWAFEAERWGVMFHNNADQSVVLFLWL